MKKAVGFQYRNPDPGGAQGYIFPILRQILQERGNRGKILDIGCGNGSVARQLEREGFEVWGCEWDPAGVRIANQGFPGRFMVWNVNDPADQFPWGGFGSVISCEVIEHLFLPRNFFRLARRVLVPDGLLILTTPYHGYLKNLVLSILNKWDWHHHVAHDGGHIKFFSVRTLQKMMQEEGFTMDGWQGAGRFPGLWKSMILWGRKKAD